MSYPLHSEFICSNSEYQRARPVTEHSTFPVGEAPWDKPLPGMRDRISTLSREPSARIRASLRASAPTLLITSPEEPKKHPELKRRHSLTDTAQRIRPNSSWGFQYLQAINEKDVYELERSFDKEDKGHNNCITAEGLAAMNCMKGMNLSLNTCERLLGVFNRECNGKMLFQEFAQIKSWTVVMYESFQQYCDRDGYLNFQELQQTLARQGFHLDKMTLQRAIKRTLSLEKGTFSLENDGPTSDFKMDFDQFMALCAFLGRLRSLFEKLGPSKTGYININFEQMVDFVVLVGLEDKVPKRSDPNKN